MTFAAAKSVEDKARSEKSAVRFVQALVAVALVAGCLALFAPISPIFPAEDGDSGWMLVLNEAVEKGLVFGRDIIFTFGPYGSTYTGQYHPATDVQMLWSSALIVSAFALGLLFLARDRYRASALLSLPMIALIEGPDHLATCPDLLFLCVPIVFLLLVSCAVLPVGHRAHIRPTRRLVAVLALLTIALSLLPLVKGTFGLAALAAIVLGVGLLAVRGHAGAALAGIVIFVAGLSAFWMIAGQPIASLPGFFAAQGPIISGYTDAMSILGPPIEPVIYLIACCLVGLLQVRFVRSAGLPGVVLACGVALQLFIAFKGGFVRHDGHALIAAETIGFAGWSLLLALPGARSLLGLLVCLTAWATIDPSDNNLHLWTIKSRVVEPFIGAATGLAARIETKGALKAQFEDSLARIRAVQPLPSLQGATDIYSYGQSALIANGLETTPRPIFQSYSAYAPRLLQENAAFVSGPKAPQNILFRVQAVDNRFAPLEDSLSWPILLTRYEPLSLIGDLAVLRRRAEPTAATVFSDRPLLAGTYGINEEIALPANAGVLWAKAIVGPTLLGSLLSAVYKPPELRIEFRLTAEKVGRYRYIAEMGEAGFIVSPLVRSVNDFLALELADRESYFSDSHPRSMMISIAGGRISQWMWRKDVSVEIRAIDVPPQNQVEAILFAQSFVKAPVGDPLAKPLKAEDCFIDSVNGDPLSLSPTTVRGVLRVEGWAAMSLDEGAAPEKTRIILTAKDGETYALAAKAVRRSDVNQLFGKPEMGDVGFDAMADVASLQGDYTLSIEATAKGETRICPKSAPIRIAAPRKDGQE